MSPDDLLNHFKNTNNDMKTAYNTINELSNLYKDPNYIYTAPRHYSDNKALTLKYWDGVSEGRNELRIPDPNQAAQEC